MVKYGRAGHAIDDNVIWCMSFACCITKTTDTHSEYEIRLALHGNNDYTKAPCCQVHTYITCQLFVHLN